MRNVITIAIHDLRVYLKSPGIVAGMVVAPIIMTIALGLGLGALNSTPDRIRVDVIDNDGSTLSARFLDDLRAVNSALRLCPFDNTEDDYCQLDYAELTQELALKRLSNNTSLALIEIPADFEAHLNAGEPASITYRSNESAAAPSYILQAVQAVAQRMGGALVAAEVGVRIADDSGQIRFADDTDRTAFRQGVYDRAAQLWAQNPVTLDYQTTEVQTTSTTQTGFGQSIPGMATMFTMFFVFTGMINLVTERKNWTLQRLVTLPVRRGEILGGKMLMYFLLGMIQFLIVFAIGLPLRINFGSQPLALLVVMAVFTFCIASLTFAISTMLRTDMQGAALINLLGLTLAPLGGAWWPLDVVPDFMRTVGHISPVAWAMDSFRLLIFENGTLAHVLPNLAVLLAMTVMFFIFAVWRFRYE